MVVVGGDQVVAMVMDKGGKCTEVQLRAGERVGDTFTQPVYPNGYLWNKN